MMHNRYGIYYKGQLAVSFLTLSKARSEAFLLIKNKAWDSQQVEVKPICQVVHAA